MDLDLGQARAFVVAAESRHFGRTAAALHLTQQAVSKRIRRLENALGTVLLVRDSRGVALTPAGQAFLPHARSLLAASESAIAEARAAIPPVRVDVWDQTHSPLTIVREVAARVPHLSVEVSMRRSLPAAMEALLRHDVDVAFGRVIDVAGDWRRLDHRLVLLEPIGLLMSSRNPLASADALTPGDLATAELWFPAGSSPPELMGAVRRFASRCGAALETDGTNLGLGYLIDELEANPTRAVPMPMGVPLPAQAPVRLVPAAGPTYCWPWSVVWRRGERGASPRALVAEVVRLSGCRGWARFDPDRHWLDGSDPTGSWPPLSVSS